MEHQRRVGLAGQDQFHIDTSSCRRFQCGEELRVGYEVGVGDADARFRTADGREQRGVDQAVGFVGCAADGPHHLRARTLQSREVVPRWQRVTFLRFPGGEEQFLELRDHGPLHLKVGVAPSRAGVTLAARTTLERTARVHTADVDAAQERDAPVDDQQLAVVALIQLPILACHRRVDRIELEHADTAVLQLLKELRRRVDGPHAVVDEIDLDPLPLLLHQSPREALAHLVVLQDVGFHVDVVACCLNRREHRLVGGRTVLQQPHLIAGRERTAHDGLLERQVAREDVGFLPAARQPIKDHLALCGSQRAARALELYRRVRPAGQIRNDGGKTAATGDAQQHQWQPSAQGWRLLSRRVERYRHIHPSLRFGASAPLLATDRLRGRCSPARSRCPHHRPPAGRRACRARRRPAGRRRFRVRREIR